LICWAANTELEHRHVITRAETKINAQRAVVLAHRQRYITIQRPGKADRGAR